MQDEDQELAAFQACLLEALHKHTDAVSTFAELRSSATVLPFADYVNSYEPEMLELAAILVKKWGKKSSSQTADLSEMPH